MNKKRNMEQGNTNVSKAETDQTFRMEGRTPGILRSESSSRPLRLKTSPLLSPTQVEPSSPQPSVDRLSVTFAITEDDVDDSQEENHVWKVWQPDSGHTKNGIDMQRIAIADGEEEGDEDEYSASACAIMQRRSSSRRQSRRKRRPSSPFGIEAELTMRRRSSAYTISSEETAISMEESGNQEQIFEKLKLHKEVLSGVKQQPWSLRRKIKLVRQAKSYVRRHEGVLQERLAHTRSTKDAVARISLFISKKWQYFRRELINLQTWLVPWELRIKEIESHFGSAVASYFIFLRWLFWINLVISAALTAFVAIPEVLTADATVAGERKIMLREERIKSKHLLTLWEFEGILKYSPFFYGWYTNQDSDSGYRLPLAYFVTNLVVYTYSFVAILRKMAENSRLSKLTEKEDECVFSWKLFTGWDFMIGNPETAHNRMASIVLGFKEALLEEAEKQKDERNWKIITIRIFVNVSVISLLALSAYAVIKVVGRSAEEFEQNSWWRQNEITIVMSLITYVFPLFFEILGFLENYHPRKQLRMQLARIMVLNLLNLYSLIFALFGKINTMKQDLDDLKPKTKSCTYKPVKCNDDLTNTQHLATLASLSLILMSNATYVHVRNESTLPTFIARPQDYYLNPLLDNETLEEIYNAQDYPPLDYSYYENYDINDNEDIFFNETTLIRTDEDRNTTENFTTQTFVPSEILNRNSTSGIEVKESTTDLNNSTEFTSLEISKKTIPYDEGTDQTSSSISSEKDQDLFSTASKSLFETKSDNFDESSIVTTLRSSTKSQVVTTLSEDSDGDEISTSSTPTESDGQVIPLEEKNYVVKCFEQVCTTTTPEDLATSLKRLDPKTRKKLRRLCWETMFGQELAKLTVMDLVLTIVSTLGMDFFRALFVRFMNNFWCWDLEKQFPQYGDFKIAENILHLVNNQGMVWMGMFFSPGLTALNLLKLGILMYLRSWAVLTCNVPHEVIFRASRSNNFYFALLLTMLFLCVLPVGYAIVWVEPSWHCGPFSGYQKIYHLASKRLTDSLPEPIQRCLDYIASPGIVIPLIVLMTLIIYYMASLAGSLREANNDLKIQLRHERTEERRKLFKIVEKRQQVMDASVTKWKKIFPIIPSTKFSQSTPSKVDPDVAIELENSVDVEINQEKHTVKPEPAEIINVEQHPLSNDQTSALERSYSETKPTSSIRNNRMRNVLSDSCESQSSDCAIIPEIRINEAEEKHRSYRPRTDSAENDVTLTRETSGIK